MLTKHTLNLFTMLVTLALCSVANTNKIESDFLTSIDWDHWHHMTEKDIGVLAARNFVADYDRFRKLPNATSFIIPAKNIADDPLNHFVGGKNE